jgi:hypothetical protein
MKAQPIGDERGFRLAFDFDLDVRRQQVLGVFAPHRVGQAHLGAHAPPGPNGCGKSHAIETVVEHHLRAL